MSYTRLRNRILQAFYRPPSSSRRRGLLNPVFSELDEIIEKNITPLLAELFKD
jgi:hypothetical protein